MIFTKDVAFVSEVRFRYKKLSIFGPSVDLNKFFFSNLVLIISFTFVV